MTRLALLAILLAASPVNVQPRAGDYIVSTALGTFQLFAYSPTGQVVWSYGGVPTGISAVTMAPNNRDLVALTSSSSGNFLVTITPSGSVSTLARLPIPGRQVVAWQDGGYRIPFPVDSSKILAVDAAGFSGRLDKTGSALGSIAIPPAVPRGTRFFVSFVTIGNGRILSVANTAGFTVR
jgi:hypothetical protein